MQLPASWVDQIFARLSVRYGAEWTRKWEGIDIVAVKKDWANELGGLSNRSEPIIHALANLPIERPPTVSQFLALCIARPDPGPKELAAPPANPELVAEIVSRIPRLRDQDPKAWAKRLQAREVAGEKLTRSQRDMWREALATPAIESAE